MTEYYKTVNKKGEGVAFFISTPEDEYVHLRCIESSIKNFTKNSYYYIAATNIGKDINGYTLVLCSDSEKCLLTIKTNGGKNV